MIIRTTYPNLLKGGDFPLHELLTILRGLFQDSYRGLMCSPKSRLIDYKIKVNAGEMVCSQTPPSSAPGRAIISGIEIELCADK